MSAHLQAEAFVAVEKLKGQAAKLEPLHGASLELAHLLRAHGLAATMGYCLSSAADQDDAASARDRATVAGAFLDLLDAVCTLPGADRAPRAASLKTEPHSTYLLHSRIALRLADAWEMAARVLLKPKKAIAVAELPPGPPTAP